MQGSPASVQIYACGKDLQSQPLARRSFFRCSTVQLNWNRGSTGLLAVAQSDVDKTNQSYYGESKLNYLTTDGTHEGLVPLRTFQLTLCTLGTSWALLIIGIYFWQVKRVLFMMFSGHIQAQSLLLFMDVSFSQKQFDRKISQTFAMFSSSPLYEDHPLSEGHWVSRVLELHKASVLWNQKLGLIFNDCYQRFGLFYLI